MKRTFLGLCILTAVNIATADEWTDQLTEQLRESQRDSDERAYRFQENMDRDQALRQQREQIEIERRQLQNDLLFGDSDRRHFRD
jgi:hypothetical protein